MSEETQIGMDDVLSAQLAAYLAQPVWILIIPTKKAATPVAAYLSSQQAEVALETALLIVPLLGGLGDCALARGRVVLQGATSLAVECDLWGWVSKIQVEDEKSAALTRDALEALGFWRIPVLHEEDTCPY